MDPVDGHEWLTQVEIEATRLIERIGEENAKEIARLSRQRSLVGIAQSLGVVQSTGIAQSAFDLLARLAPAPQGYYGELTARQAIDALRKRYPGSD